MRVSVSVIVCTALAALGCAATASAASAQDDTSRPVLIAKQNPKVQKLKFKGEVVSANSVSITLRGQDNPREIQTFTYSTQVRDQMLGILKQGGYRAGDKVTVEYLSGTTVAQHISGKPSKPH
ncbi:MAG TPA: hypothetical protein VFO34_08660 [Candidatus Acidoferrales bacterium]|nr:hypothetical protein [Candidatus Acidoferrales bacterium]